MDPQVPRSTYSTTSHSFKDFLKICKAYYKELKSLLAQEKAQLSQNDLFVLNDLMKELFSYTNVLIKSQSFFEEIKKLLKLSQKISDALLKIFNRGEIPEKDCNISIHDNKTESN